MEGQCWGRGPGLLGLPEALLGARVTDGDVVLGVADSISDKVIGGGESRRRAAQWARN